MFLIIFAVHGALLGSVGWPFVPVFRICLRRSIIVSNSKVMISFELSMRANSWDSRSLISENGLNC